VKRRLEPILVALSFSALWTAGCGPASRPAPETAAAAEPAPEPEPEPTCEEALRDASRAWGSLAVRVQQASLVASQDAESTRRAAGRSIELASAIEGASFDANEAARARDADAARAAAARAADAAAELAEHLDLPAGHALREAGARAREATTARGAGGAAADVAEAASVHLEAIGPGAAEPEAASSRYDELAESVEVAARQWRLDPRGARATIAALDVPDAVAEWDAWVAATAAAADVDRWCAPREVEEAGVGVDGGGAGGGARRDGDGTPSAAEAPGDRGVSIFPCDSGLGGRWM